MKYMLFIPLFFIQLVSLSQSKTAFQRYKEFLKPDKEIACHMLYVGLHLQYAVPSNISSSGQGTVLGLGLNVARAFTKKMHLGIYGTYKPRELLFPCGINSSFSSDLQSHADYSNLDHNDSLVASYFVNKSSQKHALGGCGRYQYGISFYLPVKYFPLIKVYKGSTIELIDTDTEVRSITGDPDWIYFHYNTYGFELTLLYDYKNKNNLYKTKFPFSLTVFCEKNRVGTSDINGIKLDSFMNQSFFDQYNKSWRIGIKVGMEIW